MIQEKISVIIDCDPGIDDTLALTAAYALPQLDILGVCSVGGNVDIERTTLNARRVLGKLGVQSKIYKGVGHPLMWTDANMDGDVHGETGLGNYTFDDVNELHPLEDENALDAQYRIISENKNPVTIIALGPLTNIALLLRIHPEIKSKIERIVLMGGGLFEGNATPAAEFNFYVDPESANIVFNAGIPILMAGLDITHKAKMSGQDVINIANVGNPVGEMCGDLLLFYYGGLPSMEVADSADTVHDVVPVLALVYPELFSGEDFHVSIETEGRYCRGKTLADNRMNKKRRATPNCHVLLDLDLQEFQKVLLDCISKY